MGISEKIQRRYYEQFLPIWYQIRFRKALEKEHKVVLFLGYPRSGHSLVGALLDAHPQALISHELDALRFLEKGESRLRIFSRILAKSAYFLQSGSSWTGYSYRVPGQYQGRFTELKVIGDKKGGVSTRRIMENPKLLDAIQTLGKEVFIIHVMRNPFDNIATRGRGTVRREVNIPLLEKMIERHLEDARLIQEIKESGKYPILECSNESLIDDPKGVLKQLCEGLGLEPLPDYLDACASIIKKSPHQSRHKVEWPDHCRKRVLEGIADIPFLQHYTFEN